MYIKHLHWTGSLQESPEMLALTGPTKKKDERGFDLLAQAIRDSSSAMKRSPIPVLT